MRINKTNLLLLGAILLGCAAIFALKYEKEPVKTVQSVKPLKTSESLVQSLQINDLSEYDGLSKEEIFNLRKSFVSSSVFNAKNYSPSDEVFSRVESGRPWYGIQSVVCEDTSKGKTARADGFSSLSRFINNPAILLGIMQPYMMNVKYDEPLCSSEGLKFIPEKLTFDAKNKVITAIYRLDKKNINHRVNWFGKSVNVFYTLTGLNARDFGFEYIFIDKKQGLEMMNESNAAKNVYQLRDFLHVGGSCGLDGGCNNVSPAQTELDFIFTTLPAEMEIKLWKKQPLSKLLKADFKYKIIFTES